MHLQRTKFNCGIVAEFIAPIQQSDRILILLDGMPAMPSKKKLLLEYAKQGYWVFHIRYRGSWESDGVFLEKSPHIDILDVLDELPRGFIDAWTGEQYSVATDHVVLMGASFAGPALLLASSDSRVKKVIAVSPVVDWQEASEEEPLDKMFDFTKKGFNNAYRFATDAHQKLASGDFYNPATSVSAIDGSKVFILHAIDDPVVLADPVKKFAKEIGAVLHMKRWGGHLSSSAVLKFFNQIKVNKFLSEE